uniref:Uncharacterized protein n=1 Tax=Arundo donax TaxID=35708 RepID=A0A0A9FIB4_ARUDO
MLRSPSKTCRDSHHR